MITYWNDNILEKTPLDKDTVRYETALKLKF